MVKKNYLKELIRNNGQNIKDCMRNFTKIEHLLFFLTIDRHMY
jgi:hypothetical protein